MMIANSIGNGWTTGLSQDLRGRGRAFKRRRRSSRSSYRPRPAVMIATLILAVTPFILASSGSVLHRWISNRALAASEAADGRLMKPMTAGERARQRHDLRDLLGGNPDMILKLVEDDVTLAFAQPDLRRFDGATRVWQYRAGDCVMDIYFQDNADQKRKDGSVSTVAWYELRQRSRAELNKSPAQKTARKPDNAGCVQTFFDAADSAGRMIASR